MNPWQLIRREIDGAVRSFRYDMARRRMNDDTASLPGAAADSDRSSRRLHRIVLTGSALLLVSGGVGSYHAAVGSGLDALFADTPPPDGLPASSFHTAAPSPWRSLSSRNTTVRVTTSPTAGPSPARRPRRSPKPALPAPTCPCRSPLPSPSPRPSLSPSPAPAGSPAADPVPTALPPVLNVTSATPDTSEGAR